MRNLPRRGLRWLGRRWLPVIAVALAVSAAALAQEGARPASIEGAQIRTNGRLIIGTHTAHLEDRTGLLTIDNVRVPALADRFVAVDQEQPNFGYSSSAHWLRFTLARDAADADLLLEVALPSLDSIQLFYPLATASGASYSARSSGDQAPWHTRAIKHRNHLFVLRAAPDQPVTYDRAWSVPAWSPCR